VDALSAGPFDLLSGLAVSGEGQAGVFNLERAEEMGIPAGRHREAPTWRKHHIAAMDAWSTPGMVLGPPRRENRLRIAWIRSFRNARSSWQTSVPL